MQNWLKRYEKLVVFLAAVTSCTVAVVGFALQHVQAAFAIIGVIAFLTLLAFAIAAAQNFRHRRDSRHHAVDKKFADLEASVAALRSSFDKEAAHLHSLNSEPVERLHEFIHAARDSAVSYVKNLRNLVKPKSKGTSKIDLYSEYTRLRAGVLEKLLPKINDVFESIVSKEANLWVAIRELRTDPDGVNRYHTALRHGRFSHVRADASRPISETEGLAKFLREEYAHDRGIVIIRKGDRTPEHWLQSPNDHLEDDTEIMAGPVFLKLTEPYAMTMILLVNSHVENVFRDEHKPYLKCCVDVLSMFMNMITGLIEDVQHKPHG